MARMPNPATVAYARASEGAHLLGDQAEQQRGADRAADGACLAEDRGGQHERQELGADRGVDRQRVDHVGEPGEAGQRSADQPYDVDDLASRDAARPGEPGLVRHRAQRLAQLRPPQQHLDPREHRRRDRHKGELRHGEREPAPTQRRALRKREPVDLLPGGRVDAVLQDQADRQGDHHHLEQARTAARVVGEQRPAEQPGEQRPRGDREDHADGHRQVRLLREEGGERAGGHHPAVGDVEHVGQPELEREPHRADRDKRPGDDAKPDRLDGEFSHALHA